MDKGLVLVTFDRENLCKNLLNSITLKDFKMVVVVKDGNCRYTKEFESKLNANVVYLPQDVNVGTGPCKQLGVNYLLENSEIEHVFIIEDDILIKDNKVWDYYIDFSHKTGIWHTNWNNMKYSQITCEIEFDGLEAIINREHDDAFSYFHRNMFKFCEFSPDIKTIFEGLSIELQLIEKDLLPPFWNFVCPKGTDKFISDVKATSTIVGKKDFEKNYQEFMTKFKQRHGKYVADIPEPDMGDVFKMLNFLRENYSK